ncbi:hypothetical protein [Microvirga tunisiensis]|uniref:Uncharacterized protein n=1 Tax=Microvirga tunisiensis TaxID=2108360 RepID=A0A5N7MBU6_9HYPH|nr:hypothetical protein [Microvirga tunisiensis]MPR06324.1 hypothetical protein [Microvirga tunisiensis]MPR24110.1 hypothetical protein [Microvirga tunisiensis]
MKEMSRQVARKRAYSKIYPVTMTISGMKVTLDQKKRPRCDFWGTAPNGRRFPCAAIGPNYQRLRDNLITGATLDVVGVYETARPEAGKAPVFHLISINPKKGIKSAQGC